MKAYAARAYHSRWVQRPLDRAVDFSDAMIGFRERRSVKRAVKLFWANDAPNFGDALSVDVVRRLCALPVMSSSSKSCNIISIGSIYPWLKFGFKRRLNKVHVWGSGALSDAGYLKADGGFDVRLVRGPLTARAMGVEGETPFGDPGLLASDVFDVSRDEDASDTGLVLHMDQLDDLDEADLKSLSRRFKIIDVRTFDAASVVERIAGCRRIVSSSLHGLVVADGLGIPNARLDFRRAGQFKFSDYYMGVEKEYKCFDSFSDLRSSCDDEARYSVVSGETLKSRKLQIINSFPFERGAPLSLERRAARSASRTA